MPAPISPNESHRLRALRECCVLDTAPEEGFDEITAIAAEVAATPIALISLVDEDRQWFKSRVGLDAEETPRDLAFCAHAILESRPLIVEDARDDDRFKDNPLVVGPPRIRFYAGFPLELGSGERLGTLCVIDDRPRVLTEDCLRLLHRLSREATANLELRRSLDRLDRLNQEREEIIEELRRIQLRLDATNRAKSEFLANMSHEIRTPMTAIIGFLDLVEDPAQDEAQRREHIATIRRNARHLLGLINGILDLSKVEAGKMTVERIETSPLAIVREVESLNRVRADEKGLDLKVEFETAIPRTIATDPVRLQQILTNLVANAIKFTDAGGVTIRVGLDRSEPDPRLRIAVTDTGIGIDREYLDRLFGAFEQGDASTTRRFGGTGLGLKIAERLSHLLDGCITVESEPGRGSTFTLLLPAGAVDETRLFDPRRPTASACERPSAAGPAPGAPGAALRGRRVLVADDAADNRHLLSYLLKKAGAEVVTAEDGVQAVAAVEDDAGGTTPIELLVLDMQMPNMDGFDAARALRERGHTLGILALTAGAMVGDREKCIGAGCDDYLTKPIEPPEFLRRCAALVARAR